MKKEVRCCIFLLTIVAGVTTSYAFKIVPVILFKSAKLTKKLHELSATPYLTALRDSVSTLKHRFFFPGHSGYAVSNAFNELVGGSQPCTYDLPELDELDNIHSPEVQITSFGQWTY